MKKMASPSPFDAQDYGRSRFLSEKTLDDGGNRRCITAVACNDLMTSSDDRMSGVGNSLQLKRPQYPSTRKVKINEVFSNAHSCGKDWWTKRVDSF